jgi:hypothetical protein
LKACEARGHVEGVLDGEAILKSVQTLGEIEVVAVVAFQPLRQFARTRAARPVELGAVAGREDHRLGDAVELSERAQRGGQAILPERHLFAQCYRRGLVVKAEDVDCH